VITSYAIERERGRERGKERGREREGKLLYQSKANIM
jgi:predicted transposase YdaD